MSKYVIALFSGLLFSLGFSPFNFLFLTIVSLSSFLFLLEKSSSLRESFRISFIFGIGVWSIGISWVIVSIYYHGDVSLIVSVLITSLFIVLLSLYKSLVGIIYFKLKKNFIFNALVLFPFAWVFVETLRGFLFSGFPWLLLGISITNSPLSGFLPIFGSSGSSIILCIISALLVITFNLKRSNKLSKYQINKIRMISGSFLIILVSTPPLLLNKISWTEEIGKQKVSIYQPNLTLEEKWSYEGIAKTRNLLKKALLVAENKELIIFPETAFISNETSRESFFKSLEDLLSKKEIYLITGILGTKGEARTNTLHGYGLAKGTYDKVKLVPFGEYVPFLDIFGNFLNFIGINITNMQPGYEYKTLKIGKYVVSPTICYEIAFESIVLETASISNLFITLSNDTWFGDSIGPYQHLEISQARAIEHERAVLRSTNSGISAIINEKGEIQEKIGIFEDKSLNHTVSIREGTTPYSYFKRYPLYLYLLLIFMYLYKNNRTNVTK